jgi:hypothetical protein
MIALSTTKGLSLMTLSLRAFSWAYAIFLRRGGDAVALPRFALFLIHCAQRLSVFSLSVFSFSLRRGRRRPTSLRAFPDSLRAAPFSFQLFRFQLFSSAGRPTRALRPHQVRINKDAFRAFVSAA